MAGGSPGGRAGFSGADRSAASALAATSTADGASRRSTSALTRVSGLRVRSSRVGSTRGSRGRAGCGAQLLVALIPCLWLEQLGKTLLAALPVHNEYYRSLVLAALAPRLGQEQLGEALAAAKAIANEGDRSRALAALAPHLAPQQLGEALAAAKAIDKGGGRFAVLAALAPSLAKNQLGDAIEAAMAIRNEDERARAFWPRGSLCHERSTLQGDRRRQGYPGRGLPLNGVGRVDVRPRIEAIRWGARRRQNDQSRRRSR